MSLFRNSYVDKLSLLHVGYAAWNLGRFIVADNVVDGYTMTYLPFAAGTSLVLAVAPASVRVGHAVVTMVVCAPHLLASASSDRTNNNIVWCAKLHFGASHAYLVAWKLKWVNAEASSNKGHSPKMRLSGRMLSGMLAASQLGISMWFGRHYLTGDPSIYLPFIREILSTTDKVPFSTLTDEFLTNVYYSGTYAVTGIGWSLSLLLSQAVYLNQATRCAKILSCMALNVSTQVAISTVCYFTKRGGSDLGDYWYVHGPMSVPAIVMILGAWYLVQRGTTTNATKGSNKSD